MSAFHLTFPDPSAHSSLIATRASSCLYVPLSVQSVSLLLLVFKYCSSRHDGATHIVSMSHAPLCTRLIMSFRHLHFFYLLAAALLHNYDHILSLGFVCALSIWSYLFFAFLSFICHLITVHINTNRHDITFALLATFFSLYVAFVFIDPCGAARCRCTLTVILWPRFPIFRWCNTILRSWGDRWSPMLMLYYLCGNSKESRDACGTSVIHAGASVAVFLMTRAEKPQRGGC